MDEVQANTLLELVIELRETQKALGNAMASENNLMTETIVTKAKYAADEVDKFLDMIKLGI